MTTLEEVNELCIINIAELLMDDPVRCEQYHTFNNDNKYEKITFILNFVDEYIREDLQMEIVEDKKVNDIVTSEMYEFIIDNSYGFYDGTINNFAKNKMKIYSLWFWNNYTNKYMNNEIDYHEDQVLNYLDNNTYYSELLLK